MKKQKIVNLVKYHVDNNEMAFRTEVASIASEFDKNGDSDLALYLMSLISDANVFVPQDVSNINLKYFHRVAPVESHLIFPEAISDDIIGVLNTRERNSDVHKFLFYGGPGTGKTESVIQIAKILGKEVLAADFSLLIDAKLGESAKNITSLFREMNSLPSKPFIFLFDEIDAIALNRIDNNDVREMGRVTSTFLREIDNLKPDVFLIATTNLYKSFDDAVLRRFDAAVNFDKYTKENLVAVAETFYKRLIAKDENTKLDIKLFEKILSQPKNLPNPGELINIIRKAVGFSSKDNQYEYFRRLFKSLVPEIDIENISELNKRGFTVREIEILTKISKSSVSRKLKDGD